MRLRLWAFPVALALLAGATPARAYVPERTPQRDLEGRARTSLAQPATRGSTAGIVVERGGRALVDVAGDTAFVPASLLKLLTTTAAILRFGPDHRFATRVLASGPASTPRTLALVGGGDPTLATEAFRRYRYVPKPTDEIKVAAFPHGSPTLDQLAAQVEAAGVRRVDGDLVADESVFDAVRRQPGWLDRYLDTDPETGLLSGLTVNEGMLDLKGTHIAPSPAASAAAFFRAALVARGIRVGGRIRVARAPSGGREIARVLSPTVADIVGFTLRYSINFDAEILLKGLGAAFAGAGTTTAGVRVVRAAMASLAVPTTGLVMADGSGLSLTDRMTPRTVAALLEHVLEDPGPAWDALRAGMPVAGRPGTLQKRLKRAPTAGNLRGKTGSLAHVRAMAGWVTAEDGVPLIYVAIFNDVARPASLTGVLDLLGTLLADAG